MQTKTFTHTQKRSKRVVVIYDVPISRTLPDGTELLSMPIAEQVDSLLNRALALGMPRVELWFIVKTKSSKKIDAKTNPVE